MKIYTIINKYNKSIKDIIDSINISKAKGDDLTRLGELFGYKRLSDDEFRDSVCHDL